MTQLNWTFRSSCSRWLVWGLILLGPAMSAHASPSAPSDPGALSEWEHQGPVDAIEITPIYTSESDKSTPQSNSSVLSAGKKSGSQYGLRAEYGWMQALTLGVQGNYASDGVALTPASSSATTTVQTNGIVGFSAFIKGNVDFTSNTFAYGLEYKSLNAYELITANGVDAAQTGYQIIPYLGLEFKLNGAVTGVQVKYLVMGNQSLKNEVANPTTTQTVSGGNAVKGTLFYEENFSFFKLGAAFIYTSASATQDTTTSLTNNDASTSMAGSVYLPIYFSTNWVLLPSALYTAQSFSSSLAALKGEADFDWSVALRVGF